MNISSDHPRIYKKKERLNLKPLARPSGQEYLFWSKDTGIKVCVRMLNNLNEIVARSFHKINKLSSHFGISKNPADKLSKNPNNFNKYLTNIKGGGNKGIDDLRKSVNNLENQNLELIKNIKSLQDIEIDLKESLSEILALANNINDKT